MNVYTVYMYTHVKYENIHIYTYYLCIYTEIDPKLQVGIIRAMPKRTPELESDPPSAGTSSPPTSSWCLALAVLGDLQDVVVEHDDSGTGFKGTVLVL